MVPKGCFLRVNLAWPLEWVKKCFCVFVCYFNGISTVLGYLMPNPSFFLEWESWYYLTLRWEDKRVHTFPKGICPKVNAIAWLEFELSYYNSIVHPFNPIGTPPARVWVPVSMRTTHCRMLGAFYLLLIVSRKNSQTSACSAFWLAKKGLILSPWLLTTTSSSELKWSAGCSIFWLLQVYDS